MYAYTAAAERGGYVLVVSLPHFSTRADAWEVTGPVEVGDAKTYIDGFVNSVNSVGKNITISRPGLEVSDVASWPLTAKTHIANGLNLSPGSSQSVIGSIWRCQGSR